MSAQTVGRQLGLLHRLPAEQAIQPADPRWVRRRLLTYQQVAGIPAMRTFTDRDAYACAKGEPLRPDAAGEAHTGLPGSRLTVPLVFVDPARCGTRALAETVVAHEVTHARYLSLGHSQRFFDRVQELLDGVAAQENRLGAGPATTVALTLLRRAVAA